MKNILEKKQELIKKMLLQPFMVGEEVKLKNDYKYYPILEVINGDTLIIKERYGSLKTIQSSEVDKRLNEIYVGANPFSIENGRITTSAYSIESIYYKFNKGKEIFINKVLIKELNWNPWVINSKGIKEYYQRDFVWTDNDKRLLIDSFYNNIDCGKILIKTHSWEKVELYTKNGGNDMAFHDIIDGKQRLNAIFGFINNEFKDNYGNFYSDLSYHAQNKLLDSTLLTYCSLDENSSDEAVIEQFLKLNFTGIPQSKEHINFVKNIYKNL